MNLFGKEKISKKQLPQYDSSDDFDILYERIKRTGKPYRSVNGVWW